MIALSDFEDLHERHVLDSLRAVPHLPADARRACDLGSGAGLPGVPLAIACEGMEVTLAETRRSRAAFLELAVESLPLPNAVVYPGRVEELGGRGFDVCTARGFADLPQSWVIARGLLRTGGRLLYWAGASFSEERIPPEVTAEVVAEPPLESRGPIVIMTRQ
jgi:16S rRNA (guanine527-N7)-methyltransferase